jgi:hypothetical protein
MPMAGRKPKPEGQRRNRMKPVHEWVEVPDQPYADPPELPATPRTGEGMDPPEPTRPLGMHGRDLWNRTWRRCGVTLPDADALQQLCELTDERIPLRVAVLQYDDWRKRNALRDLDRLVMAGLAAIDAHRRPVPTEWPDETRRWWAAVSAMPHCVLWTDTDWRYALDTARVAACFHSGDVRWASELRTREKVLGTTLDSRRDLRIRYVDPDRSSEAEQATVTAMESYRKAIGQR